VNSKHLKGLAVISIADGEKLGTIDKVYLDPAAKRVVGFAVKHHGGLFSPETPNLIDVDDIHSLGPDALTLDDKAAVRGDQTSARLTELVELDDLLRRKVVTEGGTYVGQVAEADIAEHGFGVEQIEVSPGFFKTNKQVAIDQVVSIGHDVVVVADEVCAPEGTAEAGTTPAPPAERRFVVGEVTASEPAP
jgi:uncharacterized protein YrrD